MRRSAWLALFSVLFMAGCGMPGSGPKMTGTTLTETQRFTLKDLKGDSVSLNDVLSKHKAVLIDFWATWCGYCMEEMPELIKLQSKFEAQGFTILGVDEGESTDAVSAYVKKAKLNFPIVLDEETEVAQAYGIVGIPTSILVASSGEVLGEYHSFTKNLEEDVEKAVKKAPENAK